MILLTMLFSMTLAFAAMTSFSFGNIVLGFIVSLLILRLTPQLPTPHSFPLPDLDSGRKLGRLFWNIFVFLYDFFKDLTISNFQIAWDILTPDDHYRPELIEVPVGDLSDFQLFLLATRITLTPGTLSVEVTADRQGLVVHVMYPPDGDTAVNLRRPIEILTRGI